MNGTSRVVLPPGPVPVTTSASGPAPVVRAVEHRAANTGTRGRD